MLLNISHCHPKPLPKAKKRLAGTILPNKCDICLIGNVDCLGAYKEARDYLLTASGGIIDLQFSFIQSPLVELQVKAFVGYYGISIANEVNFFSKSSVLMRQMVYDSKKYQEFYRLPFYSIAYYGGMGNIQYSQITWPNHWNVILHEFFHGWYSYFNLPDRTHEILNKYGGLLQKAFPEIIGELLKVWPRKRLLFYISTPKKK